MGFLVQEVHRAICDGCGAGLDDGWGYLTKASTRKDLEFELASAAWVIDGDTLKCWMCEEENDDTEASG